MIRYLLDTNHLSAYLDRHPLLEPRIDRALAAGDRVGVTLPVLCEYRAGILAGSRAQRNLTRLAHILKAFRFWPADELTSVEFGALSLKLKQAGRVLTPFDLLIASSARQLGLTVLTADSDFNHVPDLRIENWLV